jgi:Putative adhesin
MSTTRCAATAVTVLALAGMSFSGGALRKELHFRVGKHPTISINNPYGPVTVRAGVPHQVAVVATLHSDRVELDQSQSRNRINLVSHLLPGTDPTSGTVEFEVLIPPEANLNLHSDTGPLHAEKLRGDVVMEGTNAPVEVLDCADGHVHVRTVNGSVNLTNVHNGHVEVVSMYGDVVLNGVSGPVVTVNSNSGRIQYDGDFGDEGEYDFTSHTGSIEAVAPSYASIDVLARSNQGRVESDFSLEPKHTPFISRTGGAFAGTLGMAASSVRLFSFSGKIHLKKRQN